MLGIIYFVICLVMGRAIETLTRSVWEEAAQRLPNPFWLRGVLQLFCGTLCVTWLVYGVSYCFQAERHPLAYGNGIVLPATAVCAAAVLWMDRRRGKAGKLSGVTDRKLLERGGLLPGGFSFYQLVDVVCLSCIGRSSVCRFHGVWGFFASHSDDTFVLLGE